jgi:hypothetical protein
MFCAPGIIFGGIAGIRARFHVLRFRTRSRRCRGRRVLSSCLAHQVSFLAVPRASVPIFMFCAPEHVFGGAEGVVSRFHVLCVQTHFRRSRGRHVPLSCFARRDSFLAVPRASGPVFDSTEFVRSDFHVLCFELIFGGTESGGSLFHILRFRTHFSTVTGATCPVFIFCASGHDFGGTEGVRSRFYVLHAQTHFWRCRVRRVPFSCFVCPNLFSAVPRATGPVFMFCAMGLIFGGTEGVRSRFHVLRA